MEYVFAPFAAWFASGSLKYAINRLRYGKEARSRIGNGGFPSTHTSIIMTTTFMIGLREGTDSPLFALGIAVAFIIILDATGIRRAVGYHAVALNRIRDKSQDLRASMAKLRESMGHTKLEVAGGILTAIGVAAILNELFPK
ncbi:divergent PAP2 family protein [Cohnella sp. GCM10027633]|uniref:divergent PAP2 family protein n=1 Tax=unclassified Cohnella TaxID=2636738 RepID=UPI003626F7A4